MRLFLSLLLAAVGLGLSVQPGFAAASYTNTIARMSAYITSNMTAQNVPGMSIALVDDQDVVWAAGFGSADLEGRVDAEPDTVYHAGSCSKAVLGTAYMQLLDQGRVDLEAPLTQYMPEFSLLNRFTNAEPVTIRSLLNHHSGIPGDFFNGMITTKVLDNYAPWLINCLKGDYPFAPVNERYYYCNSGFVLLSDVIRRITGTNFPAAMDTMLLTPLGMDASSFLPDKPAISNRLAAAYNAEGVRQNPEILNAMGSGSLYSSVNDLSRYIRMILAEGQYDGQPIVSSNGIDVMTTPQLTNLPLNVEDVPQGLGWDNVSDARMRYAGKVFWKDGATWFHCAFIGISRDRKLGVAVMQNSPGNLCDAVGIEALRWAILEKHGIPWPTNTFEPDFSPLTNRPQAQLDALAGLYVGSEGYHRIAAQPGALTFIGNAHSDAPVVISNLVPRANGWFSLTDSQSRQLAFTNLGGHAMLVQHRVNGALEDVSPLGEYYNPEPLIAAWCERTNCVYRVLDMHPCEYFWEVGQMMPKTLRFQCKDGALFTDWVLGQFVIQPVNDVLAFQRGTHYRKGGAVRFAVTNLAGMHSAAGEFDLVHYSSYRFIDEAAIPTLPVSAITNGAIPCANGTQWYWFAGETGKTYRARLMAPGHDHFVRITDREGFVLAVGTNGPAVWTCSSNAPYAVAVSATNIFPFTASLTVEGLRPTNNDFDGDGRADPAGYQNGLMFVAFSGSGYALLNAVMGASGAIECSADYDGDGKADAAVYNRHTGLLTILLSSRAEFSVTQPLPRGAEFVPVACDCDGDRKADPAVFDAAGARWQAFLSGSGYSPAQVQFQPSSVGGLQPAPEDYDGDGLTDPAVYSAADGRWQIALSGSGYALLTPQVTAGGAGCVPAPGDYDGDGKADLMVYQPSSGIWLCALSSRGYALSGLAGLQGAALTPRIGDYDNDGRSDPAVYDEAARILYVMLSGSGYQSFSADLN